MLWLQGLVLSSTAETALMLCQYTMVVGAAKEQYSSKSYSTLQIDPGTKCEVYDSKKGVLDHACPQQRHT